MGVRPKSAFYICPIGAPNSTERRRSDALLQFVVEPALNNFNYSILRADQIQKPGNINKQIIHQLIHSDLVIADLTGHNPNVFYELAVRHAQQKPVISLIEEDQKLPFDLSQERTIFINSADLHSAENARLAISKAVEEIEAPGFEVENPLSSFRTSRRDISDEEQFRETVLDKLEEITSTIQIFGVEVDLSSVERQMDSDTKALEKAIYDLVGVVTALPKR